MTTPGSFLCLLVLGWALTCCCRAADDPPWMARSRTGMVASDSPEASQIGAGVLKAGGNAFDAAVATSFALTVARPQSTGLGGGGFLVAYVAAEQRFVALDFREMAPARATPEFYKRLSDAQGAGPPPAIYGGAAIGTPGLLAGLDEITRRFGTQPLAELVQPAIRLAETGFEMDDSFLAARREALETLAKWPQLASHAKALRDMLDAAGPAPSAGERLKRPQLAEGLRRIADMGRAAIYEGPIGEAIVAAAQGAGGVLSAEDLRAYRVLEREPLRFAYRDLEIVSMPPPSSGGVCLAEILHILEADAARRQPNAKPTPHVIVEAMKHAFADRARHLGDPDFADLPISKLLSKSYAAGLRMLPGGTLPIDEYGLGGAAPAGVEDGGTSHFCVADAHGNVVAWTETINGGFGSFIVAEPYGILLNNEMDDFLTVRGEANLFGLVQGEANLVGPGKRPLSSMSPTIVVRDGKPVLTLGASGGPRIITSVLQVMLHVIEFDRPLLDALAAVRLHHQWQPNEIHFDREPSEALRELLAPLGHALSEKRKTGIVQAIQFLDHGTFVGASDPRKGGRPAAP